MAAYGEKLFLSHCAIYLPPIRSIGNHPPEGCLLKKADLWRPSIKTFLSHSAIYLPALRATLFQKRADL